MFQHTFLQQTMNILVTTFAPSIERILKKYRHTKFVKITPDLLELHFASNNQGTSSHIRVRLSESVTTNSCLYLYKPDSQTLQRVEDAKGSFVEKTMSVVGDELYNKHLLAERVGETDASVAAFLYHEPGFAAEQLSKERKTEEAAKQEEVLFHFGVAEKTAVVKKVRTKFSKLSKEKLKDLLFDLFDKQPVRTISDLMAATLQPIVFVFKGSSQRDALRNLRLFDRRKQSSQVHTEKALPVLI